MALNKVPLAKVPLASRKSVSSVIANTSNYFAHHGHNSAAGIYHAGARSGKATQLPTAVPIPPAPIKRKHTSNKGTQTMLPCLFCRTIQSIRRRTTVPTSILRPEEDADPSHILKQIEDEFWAWRMRDSPMFSTSVGETRFNDILESYELDTYTQRKVSQFSADLFFVKKLFTYTFPSLILHHMFSCKIVK